MPPIVSILRPLLLAGLAVQSLAAPGQAPSAPSQNLFPGYTAKPANSAFPGVTPVSLSGPRRCPLRQP